MLLCTVISLWTVSTCHVGEIIMTNGDHRKFLRMTGRADPKSHTPYSYIPKLTPIVSFLIPYPCFSNIRKMEGP
ncbi:hypothetical protein F4860DRAFT_493112 [Xylaria cubensis]|nr:hypothetical protein F4860DRAFT_493112 [Xylaria cubensis]